MLVELKANRLRCEKHSEKDGDEMYLLFRHMDSNGRQLGTERVPSQNEMAHWEMKAGMEQAIDHTLYIGEVEGGLQFELTLLEMDIISPVKHALSIIGTLVDDFVGRIHIKVAPDGKVSFTDGDNTRHVYEDGKLQLHCTGNKCAYGLELSLGIS